MYVVDTNVLSVAAPARSTPSQALVGWMRRNSHRLFLSVITVTEVERGIAKAARTGASRKAVDLRTWLDQVLGAYGDRILPVDLRTARSIGTLLDRATAAGHTPDLADMCIAATALRHGYAVLTCNTRHFQPLSVTCHDPFLALPPEPG